MYTVSVVDTTWHTVRIRTETQQVIAKKTAEGRIWCVLLKMSWHNGFGKDVQIPVSEKDLFEAGINPYTRKPIKAKLVIEGANLPQAQIGLMFGSNENTQVCWEESIKETTNSNLLINDNGTEVVITFQCPESEIPKVTGNLEEGLAIINGRYGNRVFKICEKDLPALITALTYLQKRLCAQGAGEDQQPAQHFFLRLLWDIRLAFRKVTTS